MTSPPARPISRPRFVYVTEVDVSVDNGRGINEREFVKVLLEQYAREVTCVLPAPEFPGNFYDPAVRYVRPHRSKAASYIPHVLSTVREIQRIHKEVGVDAVVNVNCESYKASFPWCLLNWYTSSTITGSHRFGIRT